MFKELTELYNAYYEEPQLSRPIIPMIMISEVNEVAYEEPFAGHEGDREEQKANRLLCEL